MEEFTIEMNPATVSLEKAAALRALGVNRVSMGVQSWDPGLLETLGRVHSAAQARRSYEILREAGFDNVNLDLMFGIPGQTLAQWRESLIQTIALQPDHISAYCLTYEEDTEYFVRMTRGEYRVHVDSSETTRVVAYRGRARVSDGPRSFFIGEGTATRVDDARPGVAAYPPIRIPRSPVWTQALPTRVITLDGAASVEGRYAAPPRQHHPPRRWVQTLSRDAAFEDLVFEREVDAGETRFAAERLPEGEYFARVVSVDAERYESHSSAVQRFQIFAPRVIPSGPGRGAEVFVPQGLFCRLDDTALPSGVSYALVPGRAHVLLCATTEDMRSPSRVAISAEQAGEVLHEVRLESPWRPSGGTGPVAIRLRDASGRAYPYANITVRASPGVDVETVREEAERGLYVTRATYGANTPVTLDFVINDTVRFRERLGGPITAPPPR